MTWSKLASLLAAACDVCQPSRPANFPPPTDHRPGYVRRLFVDVSVIARSDPGTGIQKVVRNLYASLPFTVPNDALVIPVVATRHHGYRQAPMGVALNDLKSLSADAWAPINPQPGDHFLALDLATAEIVRHRAQLHRFRQAGMRFTVLVYDLLPVSNPSWFTARSAWRFRRWLRAIASLADGFLCISDDVRQNLLSWLSSSQSVHGVPAAVIPMAHEFAPTQPPEPESFLRTRPTVLVVGTVEPRKGHAATLDAMDSLWAAGHDINLLIVGQPGWGTAALQKRLCEHPENGRRLFWPQQRVSDERLAGFYAHSAGLLLPSYGEGFGLPALEAERFGRSVLTRDIPVFREIASNATRFSDDRSLPSAILAWLDAPPPPSRKTDHREPSWRDAAQCATTFIFRPEN